MHSRSFAQTRSFLEMHCMMQSRTASEIPIKDHLSLLLLFLTRLISHTPLLRAPIMRSSPRMSLLAIPGRVSRPRENSILCHMTCLRSTLLLQKMLHCLHLLMYREMAAFIICAEIICIYLYRSYIKYLYIM